MKYGTLLLHNGHEIDPNTGALSIPIYQASTFHQKDIDHPDPFDYARSEIRPGMPWKKPWLQLKTGLMLMLLLPEWLPFLHRLLFWSRAIIWWCRPTFMGGLSGF